jgi:hypothetical protein
LSGTAHLDVNGGPGAHHKRIVHSENRTCGLGHRATR